VSNSECIECGKPGHGDTWQPREVCLFGTLFACSLACAKKWAAREAAPGYRPGEPGFRVDGFTVKCDACGDVRSGTCGADDCPVPMQIADEMAPE